MDMQLGTKNGRVFIISWSSVKNTATVVIIQNKAVVPDMESVFGGIVGTGVRIRKKCQSHRLID